MRNSFVPFCKPKPSLLSLKWSEESLWKAPELLHLFLISLLNCLLTPNISKCQSLSSARECASFCQPWDHGTFLVFTTEGLVQNKLIPICFRARNLTSLVPKNGLQMLLRVHGAKQSRALWCTTRMVWGQLFTCGVLSLRNRSNSESYNLELFWKHFKMMVYS